MKYKIMMRMLLTVAMMVSIVALFLVVSILFKVNSNIYKEDVSEADSVIESIYINTVTGEEEVILKKE